MATPDPANYEFPHYEEYFTPSVEVWPPSSHLMFKPGTLINPGTFGDQGRKFYFVGQISARIC